MTTKIISVKEVTPELLKEAFINICPQCDMGVSSCICSDSKEEAN